MTEDDKLGAIGFGFALCAMILVALSLYTAIEFEEARRERDALRETVKEMQQQIERDQ